MRILQVVHHFLPEHRAGVEVHTDRVARGLMAGGEDVAVATTEDGPGRPGTVKEHDQEGLRVFRICNPRVARIPEDTLGGTASSAGFAEVLKRFHPQVAHFQHFMYVGLDAARLAKDRGSATVLTLHEYWLLCARGGQFLMEDGTRCAGAVPETCARCLQTFKFGRTPFEARCATWCNGIRRVTGLNLFPLLKRFREKAGGKLDKSDPIWQREPPERMLYFLERRRAGVASAIDSVDRMLAPSRFLMQKFLEAGWPKERLMYWPNGVSSFPRPPTLGPESPSGTPLRVGFIGSITPQKGLDVLFKAHRRLPPATIRLLIFGSEAERPSFASGLRRQAVRGEVEYRGLFRGGRSEEAFREIDVLVVPSVWYENAPLVISEAFANGVPVVASRLGGMAEMVTDGVDGLLFEPRDDADLALRLRTLAAERSELSRLRQAVRPPRLLADDVEALRGLYRSLVGGET